MAFTRHCKSDTVSYALGDAWQQLDGGEPGGETDLRPLPPVCCKPSISASLLVSPSFYVVSSFSDGDKQVQLLLRIFGLNEVMRLGQAEKYSKNSINVGHHHNNVCKISLPYG